MASASSVSSAAAGDAMVQEESVEENNNDETKRKETLKRSILTTGGRFTFPRIPSGGGNQQMAYSKMTDNLDNDESSFVEYPKGVSYTDGARLVDGVRVVALWNRYLGFIVVVNFCYYALLNVLLASTLVQDAKEGRQSEFQMTEKSARLYLIYHHWGFRYLLAFFVILNHLVAVFEEPAVTGFALPYWVTMLLEFACMLFYSLRLFHAASFMQARRFWSDKKNIVLVITISLTLVDMCSYIGLSEDNLAAAARRWSRPLRPIFLVNLSESKQIRRAFRNIRRTLPDILNVLILFFLSIALFALMGQKLFMKRALKYPDGSSYFTNYWDIFFDLYVLVTTANNPDVMMPAYDLNRWFAMFFIIYLLICLYIFMNIILAVVYNNYRKHLKNEVHKTVYMKRQNLSQAFDLLKVKRKREDDIATAVDGEDEETLSFSNFSCLMRALPFKSPSPMLISILWFVLDRNADSRIDKTDFLQLADLLNVKVSEIKDRKITFEEFFPKVYNTSVSIAFRKIVGHKYFRYFFDVLILVNAALIAFDVNQAEVPFLCFFAFEIMCKIYTHGFRRFFQKFWNVFDFIIIGAAIVGTSIETALGDSDIEKARTLDVLLVLRVLRLVKLVGSIARFRVIVMTILNLGPSILTYGGVLFVVYYMFAIVGMELFHGTISDDPAIDLRFCGNRLLNGSSFATSLYCSNNFNNVMSSMVILFELMVVNQWHILASGFAIVTHKAARLYFVAFHLTCVIIVLNIFTAFVLEAFILEYSFSKGKMETAIERKIQELGLRFEKKVIVPSTNKTEDEGNQPKLELQVNGQTNGESIEVDSRRRSSLPNISAETDIRFHISKNRDVESLLQRMFEDDLEIGDIGPKDLEAMTP